MSETSSLEDADLQYQTLSKLAVISLVLSAISCIALLLPMFAFLGIFAGLCAGFALRAIGRSDGTLAGAGIAKFALFLSIAVFGHAAGGYLVGSRLLVDIAKNHAQTWFDLVGKGERLAAHQLMLPVEDRAAKGVDLEVFYAHSASRTSDPMKEMASAMAEPGVKLLAECLQSGEQPEFRRVLHTRYNDNFFYVNLEYYVPSQDGNVLITMRREFNARSRGTYWQFWAARWKSDATA